GAIRAIVNLKKGKGGEYDESYNYALWHSSEPGSIFKLATLTALLEGEYINMESKIDAGNGKWQYGRYTISDVGRPLGLINVREAFANSSNVSFAKLAVENFGNREREFVERLSSLKIVEPLDLDIGRTAGTTIYAPGDAMWSKSSLPSMAIGYSVAITPINALTFYNAIANEGKIVYPYFIEKVEREGELLYLQNVEKAPALSICTKKSAATLKDALKSVVEIGTAKSIKDPRYTIGGKTGTARVTIDGKYSDPQGNRKYQASFVGFFPVEEPRYSVIVVIYSGKTKGNFYGGSWSAPVFKSIANNIYAMGSDWHLPIARTNGGEFPPLYPGNNSEIDRLYSLFGKEERQLAHLPEWSQFSEIGEETPLEYSPEALPNLYGMGLKDALFLAESLGYKVQFQGGGRVVSQIPLPGLQLAKGESLFLKLSTKDEIERVDRED
ncbi:MAG: penicillin-binding transpeptidase domain-containing protein, partial [Bacteroidales bacterium]